jgi:YVTN family beta-propeller protein
VAQSAGDHVAVVDTHAQRVVGSIPVGTGPTALAIDFPFGGSTTLYVANSESHTLTIIDADARRVLATVPVGLRPTGVAIAGPNSGIANSSDSEIYVADSGDDTVDVISEGHRRVLATIPVPGGPTSVIVPASGGVAYVATRSGNVDALSLADHRYLGVLLRRPDEVLGQMDYDAVTGQVYVPDATNSTVVVLRPASAGDPGTGSPDLLPLEPARALGYAGGPAAVAITFDGAYGFVAEGADGRVAMLDMGSRRTLATMDVGGAPRAIITGPYPPLVSAATALFLNLAVAAIILIIVGSLVVAGRRRPAARGGSRTSALTGPSIMTNTPAAPGEAIADVGVENAGDDREEV